MFIRAYPWLLLCLLCLFPGAARSADTPGIRLGDATTTTWRFGITVHALGDVSGILGTLPIPMDWPEQKVRIIKEDKSDHFAKLNYRTLENSVKQLIISIPSLPAGEEASAILTMEVTRRRILEPADPKLYRLPTNTAKLTKYLNPSPFIESADPKIKSLAAELTNGKSDAWDRAAAPFDWVRDHVKYEFAEQIKPAVAALQDGTGDCEELTSLIIALWRAGKIPSRSVWVPGHCYPEFYLVDDAYQGHWFPCQAAGADRQFGSMIEDRPILQKGDNFKVPEERSPQRYVKPLLTAKKAAVSGPKVTFMMERVPSSYDANQVNPAPQRPASRE